VKWPRLPTKEGEEVPLENYQKFQKNGDRQKAVARHLMRQCSTRNYVGAISESMEGFGIKKNSVSAKWKVATARQLQELTARNVLKDPVTVLVDAKHFQEDCIVVAMGITLDGTKHILGLWQGSMENSKLVKDLLTDLVERGLNPQKPLLIVLDGGKALRNGKGWTRCLARWPCEQTAQCFGLSAQRNEAQSGLENAGCPGFVGCHPSP